MYRSPLNIHCPNRPNSVTGRSRWRSSPEKPPGLPVRTAQSGRVRFHLGLETFAISTNPQSYSYPRPAILRIRSMASSVA
jgi:hypothetical protein